VSRQPGRYRILAFDGGGIRGLCAAVWVRRLEDKLPGVLDRVDLFAGTSTGAVIALALAAKLQPGELVDLISAQASAVFDDSWLDDLRDFGRLIGAQYDSKNLQKVLSDVFGANRLGDLDKKVVIPAFQLDNRGREGQPRTWKPKFFHNFPGRDSDSGERIVDVALRSCAAPTYFPSYQGYIDGGVVANNPSMAALAQALDAASGRRRLESIRLLSIGTGLNPAYIRGERLDWGLAQWARPIIALMLEGMMGVADYQCERLLGERYHRLQPPLERSIPLDAADRVDALARFASRVPLTRTTRWARRHFV